jgi:tRNA threonylcarbamoyl adenosine modification protein (Sua5/YciO/YrdC/YwlC family)
MRLRIYEENPAPRLIGKAVGILQNGGLIVYPTDTLYAFGCSLQNKKGINALYRLKQLEKKTPLSVIANNLSQASEYTRIDNHAFRIVNHYLPGPYTFILPARKETNKYMTHPRKTVGVRIPDSNICSMLTAALGHPLISTSIPLWRDEVINSGEVIDNYFGKQIDVILDVGTLVSEVSTIIDLSTGEAVLVRQGKGEYS